MSVTMDAVRASIERAVDESRWRERRIVASEPLVLIEKGADLPAIRAALEAMAEERAEVARW